jgi:trk system potassium uptake protein
MKVRQFLVIGAGRFGSALATTLFEMGHEVVVIDEREAAVEAVMERVTHAVIADATDEETLRKLGVSNFDTVIVAIGHDLEANILATVAAKTIGAKHVVAKAISNLGARVLAKVGADEVIRPEHDMGRRLAQQLATPSIVDAFKLGDAHGVVEVEAGTKLAGTLAHLRLPNRFGVQVIAVNRGGSVDISPGADYQLEPGDRVVIIGSNDAIARFREHLST